MTIPEMIYVWLSESWRVFEVPFYENFTFADFLFFGVICAILIWFLHMFFKRDS